MAQLPNLTGILRSHDHANRELTAESHLKIRFYNLLITLLLGALAGSASAASLPSIGIDSIAGPTIQRQSTTANSSPIAPIAPIASTTLTAEEEDDEDEDEEPDCD